MNVVKYMAVPLALLAAAGCGPNDAPFQSSRVLFDLPNYDTVKACGSDRKSARFERDHLKDLATTAAASFNAERIRTDFANLALDPTALVMEESGSVRVYFIGDNSGVINALGINLTGVGLEEGDPKILFPHVFGRMKLTPSIEHYSEETGLLDREPFGDRDEDYAIQPGDFVDLGYLPAGTRLEFFLISMAGNGPHVYTAHPEQNEDGAQHMVAVVHEDSPFLLLSFEDLPNLGDKDFGDLVFAVELSGYNVQALLGRIDPWRQTKRVALLVAVVGVVVGGPLGLMALRRIRRRERATRLGEEARALAGTDLDGAIDRIQAGKKIAPDRRTREALIEAECDLLERVRDGSSLAALWEEEESTIEDRENVSILAGRALVAADELDAYEALRESWRGREQTPAAWLALDADSLLHREDAAGVIELLEKRATEKPDQANLLARLALAMVTQDVNRAQELVEQAVTGDPRDTEVCLARGLVYEQTNALEKADETIQAALKLNPRDPVLRETAGHFYRRGGRFDRALDVWTRGLRRPSSQGIWLAVLFWGRVATPASLDWSALKPPPGKLAPLIAFLRVLAEDRFWDEAAFEPLVQKYPHLLDRQEVFWLRLLEALRQRREEDALTVLNMHRFGPKSWNPDLEAALLRIVTCRRAGFMDPKMLGEASLEQAGRHRFFVELDRWARGELDPVPEKLQQLVLSDKAFATACRAAGWDRAARML